MHPKDAEGIANNVDSDQTAPLWSGSALFAQTYLSENLGSLLYWLLSCLTPETFAVITVEFKQSGSTIQ